MLNDLTLFDVYDMRYQEIVFLFEQKQCKCPLFSNFAHCSISGTLYIPILQETIPKTQMNFLNQKRISLYGEVIPLTTHIPLSLLVFIVPFSQQSFSYTYNNTSRLSIHQPARLQTAV